ncbi:unnamed protein product [Paramecium primaurelia]|uniref:Uncharacterized protein n=1 Tax=Paramecium primaurelia TaxID=5886 RepID=A0A8S1PX28_PARPR|nr:unnamed protein product [Paramecium primaurelia]
MQFQNHQNQRQSRNRIFDTPISESLSLSRNLSTNFTPVQCDENQKQFIKTSQFTISTPVDQSIQEAQFQQPIQAEIVFGIQNTPQFFKQNNKVIRRELEKYIDESGQLKIDEGQSDEIESSEESLKSFPENNISNFERKESHQQQFYTKNHENQQEHTLKISDLKSEQILKDSSIQENQLDSNSQRITQNIFSVQKTQIDQQSAQSIQSVKNENQDLSISNVQISQQIHQQSFDQSNISQWSIDQIEILIQGIQVTKYSRKTLFGKKRRILQVSPDLKLIIFRNLEHKITKIYSINKITKMEKGANTETFRLYKPKSDILWLCFSIFLDERTVDLSVKTQEQLRQILDCLYGLIQKH